MSVGAQAGPGDLLAANICPGTSCRAAGLDTGLAFRGARTHLQPHHLSRSHVPVQQCSRAPCCLPGWPRGHPGPCCLLRRVSRASLWPTSARQQGSLLHCCTGAHAFYCTSVTVWFWKTTPSIGPGSSASILWFVWMPVTVSSTMAASSTQLPKDLFHLLMDPGVQGLEERWVVVETVETEGVMTWSL